MKSITIILLALCSASSVNAYSDEAIIASTLILEAGGEYAEGSMEAVYEVICNRAWQRDMTRSEVCLQYKQFSCWNSSKIAILVDKAQHHRRYIEALRIVNNRKITNYTDGANHYHADYCLPYWAPSMTVTVKIGRHIFYK
jgi:spore germination cell wall hydrolase CwlJ-like protein